MVAGRVRRQSNSDGRRIMMKYLVSAMFVSAVMCRAFAYEIATGTAISEQHVLTAYDTAAK